MFDIWYGDIELTTTAIILAIVMIPAEARLCLKAKSKTARLFPVWLFAGLGVVCLLLGLCDQTLEGIGWYLFAIFFAILLVGCFLGWVVSKILGKAKT